MYKYRKGQLVLLTSPYCRLGICLEDKDIRLSYSVLVMHSGGYEWVEIISLVPYKPHLKYRMLRLLKMLNFRLTIKTPTEMKSTSMKRYLALLDKARTNGHESHAGFQALVSRATVANGNVQLSDSDYRAIRTSVCGGWQEELDKTFSAGRFKFSAGSTIGTKAAYDKLPFIITTGWASKIGVEKGEALTVAPNRKAVIKTAVVDGATRQFIVFE